MLSGLLLAWFVDLDFCLVWGLNFAVCFVRMLEVVRNARFCGGFWMVVLRV